MRDYTGQTIGGCRILTKLGQGGMGVVYEAEQSSLNRHVAVKFLAEHLAGDEAFVSRFLREARVAAGLNHPNALAVYDVGREGDTLYMITELVRGRNLVQIVTDGGPLSEADALAIVRDVASALVEAEANGLVHRDLKPANVMVTEKDVVKVMDFGLAKCIAGVNPDLTRTGTVIGTPQYMSPEQIKNEPVDIRSDLYSLGLILFYLVTGKPAYEGGTSVSICHDQVYTRLPDPRKVTPGLSGAVRDLILQMTRKDPAKRFQSPRDVVLAAEQARQSGADSRGAFGVTLARPAVPVVRRPRRAWRGVLAALVVAAAVAGGGYWVLRHFPWNRPCVVAEPGADARIVLRWSPQGTITFLNKYGRECFGYDTDDVLGKHVVGTIVPVTESSGRDLEQMIAGISGDPAAYATNVNENICSDGRLIWVRWENCPVFDRTGKLREIVSRGERVPRPGDLPPFAPLRSAVPVPVAAATTPAQAAPRSYESCIQAGDRLLKQGEWDEAIALFESALARYPGEQGTQMWIALAREKKEDALRRAMRAELLAPDKLSVLTCPFSHFYYSDADGRPAGFDVDLMLRFAQRHELALRFVRVATYKELIPMLLENRADLIAAGMTITADRRATIDFSRPYFSNAQVLVGRRGGPLRGPEDAALRKVGYLPGTVYETTIARLAPGKAVPLRDWDAMVQALLAGDIDAFVDDMASTLLLKRKHSELEIVCTFEQVEHFGLGFRKSTPNLRAALDLLLEQAERDGVLRELYARHFE
ncbi:MAG: transporter substrate-binding domain-containing protein [Kiritimatiellae bacterium]|nr:transporter substrate-binding domain-containing protein [Kiritimatiellia bacterium]